MIEEMDVEQNAINDLHCYWHVCIAMGFCNINRSYQSNLTVRPGLKTEMKSRPKHVKLPPTKSN